MRVTRTTRGASVRHGRHLVSWLPANPGPTHSVFDVIAAAVAESTATRRPLAMLGFAAGGTVAPLRALGLSQAVRAVDLDTGPVEAFRSVAAGWAGEVAVTEADALVWLRRQRSAFGAIVEDLSMAIPGDVTKPPVSYGPLPDLIASRLAPGGVAVFNLLPVADLSWAKLMGCVCRPFAEAREIRLRDYDNRIVIASRSELPSAALLRKRLESRLDELESRLAGTLAVRRVTAA